MGIEWLHHLLGHCAGLNVELFHQLAAIGIGNQNLVRWLYSNSRRNGWGICCRKSGQLLQLLQLLQQHQLLGTANRQIVAVIHLDGIGPSGLRVVQPQSGNGFASCSSEEAVADAKEIAPVAGEANGYCGQR